MLTDSTGTGEECSASPLPAHHQRLPAKMCLGYPRDSAQQQPHPTGERSRSRSVLSYYHVCTVP